MPRVGATYVSPHGPVPDLPGEEWRDWDEFWAVSNLGRFKAYARAVENTRGTWHQRERLLGLHSGGAPGRRVLFARMQRDGKVSAVSIYRAMWIAFIGDLEPDDHVMCDGEICLANLTKKAGHPRGYRH